MPKGFASIIILLGIAIVVIIGGVVIYQKVFTPKTNPTPSPTVSPTPTANWKTYTDARGFVINYPADWYLSNDAGPLIRFSNINNFLDVKEGQVIVSLFTNTDVNFDSVKSLKDFYQNLPSNYKNIKDNFVGGNKGFIFDDADKNQRETIFANNKGNETLVSEQLVHIFITYSDSNQKSALTVFDQILSTFKFLD